MISENLKITSVCILLTLLSCDKDDKPFEPEVLWKVAYPKGVYSVTYPNASATTVVFATEDGEVHGFSTADGSKKWERKVGASRQILHNVFGEYDNHFYFDYFNQVISLKGETGEIDWIYSKEQGGLSSPEPTEAYVFSGDSYYDPPDSNFGNIYCINRTTGSFIWKRKLKATVSGIKAYMADDQVFVNTRGSRFGVPFGVLYCFKASTGDSLWSFDFTPRPELGFNGGSLEGIPAIYKGNVYVTASTADGAIVCLNRFTGQKIWATNTDNGFFCGVTIDASAGMGYTVANISLIYFNPITGEASVKHEDIGGSIFREPIVRDDFIYITSGVLRVYDRSGKLLYKSISEIADTPYLFGNLAKGTIYMVGDEVIGKDNMYLYALKPF